MPLSKTAKIIIVLAVAIGITIPCVVVGVIYLQSQSAKSGPTITLFGETVTANKTVYLSEITDSELFTQIINETLSYKTGGGSWKTSLYTGVKLWDLLVYSGVSYGSATAIRFFASDGWISVAIPLDLAQTSDHSLMLIAYAKDGAPLATPTFIVNHSVVDPKVSSQFYTKLLTKIEFLDYPDWTITINGSVSKDVDIFYSELFTYAPCPGRSSAFVHSINQSVGWSATSYRVYSGLSVKQLIDYSKVVNTTVITKIRFIGNDGANSTYATYEWVSENETMVLVSYAKDGIMYTDPVDPGYVRAIVDYNLTKQMGLSAGSFAIKNLRYIELT